MLACVLLSLPVVAQQELPWSPLGDGSAPGAITMYGARVAGGGDADGDGIGDFLVGATGAAGGEGLVYAYSGATGAPLYGGPLAPQPPAGVTGGNYQYGSSLDLSRDFNGDGRADLLIGAPQVSGFTTFQGFVSLVDGATGAVITSWAGAALEMLGSAVAAGDVNGDGVPDVIAGARNGSGGAGHVVVFSGTPPWAQLLLVPSPSPVADTAFGRAVAAANVNGDAFDDILVGADEPGPAQALGPGFVQVLLGPDGLPAPWGPVTGSLLGDHFGFAVANAGDSGWDADAFDDILVGAPQTEAGESVGYALLYDGLTGALLRSFQGEQPKDHFGYSVAGRLDFNGDGFTDLVVGAIQSQPAGQRGYVRVHSGKPGPEPPFLYRREGDKPSVPGVGSGIGLGRSLAVLGNTSVFTTDTLVASSAVHSGVGHVEVVSGRNLLLTVVPDTVSVGEILSLVTAQLAPGTLIVMLGGLPPPPPFIHPNLGVKLLPQTLFVAGIGPDESLLLSGTISAGLAGAQVLLQVAAKPAGGKIRISDIQSVQF
jgi:hypothetical protein